MAPIITELKTKITPLSNANFIEKDFSEVKKFVKESGLSALPAIIFNSNKIDPSLDPYLLPLSN
jgi:hypothetical protein